MVKRTLQSNAVVIPVIALMDKIGRITIEFHDALDSGSEDTSTEERTALLLDQYVDTLENTWTVEPGNVLYGHLRKYIQSRNYVAS